MMNIWILTIGSSNVQLKTKKNWTTLSRNVRSQLDDRGFQPSDDQEKRFRVPSRVMGVVYSQPEAAQYFEDLTFPLIDNFIGKLKAQAISIDRVILVLSDQSIFSKAERSSQSHPYWQDTCEMQGLLEKYIKSQLIESSANLHFQDPPLILKARSTAKGLDDWDEVLNLLRPQISSLDFSKDAIIYVSHQAGTPAISSAVQFCSLAKFGDRVRFLVSNEYKPELTGFVESSSYLKGIKQGQAKKLLENYDYTGVNQLVGQDFTGDDKTLLDAAIEWNVAKFHDFLKSLEKHPSFASEVQERSINENWWWIAYEEVYLAVVRKNQGNIVEAFFHSFRAFEYIFVAWSNHELGGKRNHINHIEEDKGKFYLKKSIISDDRNYFINAKFKQNGDPSNDLAKLKCRIEREERVLLDFSTIHKLFRNFRNEYKSNCQEIETFWDEKNNKENNISEKRNRIFHQISGISESDLWNFWNVTSSEEWESKLLKFLNFIVKEDFPEGFTTLEEASLMAKVHEELEQAIANLLACLV